uniref:Putative secreted protein n=1 Tax=Anopheles darlingi TaxID=43151 RepID=A0A2M4DC97_ANODA
MKLLITPHVVWLVGWLVACRRRANSSSTFGDRWFCGQGKGRPRRVKVIITTPGRTNVLVLAIPKVSHENRTEG